ncbi:MAG: hypothetical protein ACI9J0_001226, partial [Cryomorphaceae bacterium]
KTFLFRFNIVDPHFIFIFEKPDYLSRESALLRPSTRI